MNNTFMVLSGTQDRCFTDDKNLGHYCTEFNLNHQSIMKMEVNIDGPHYEVCRPDTHVIISSSKAEGQYDFAPGQLLAIRQLTATQVQYSLWWDGEATEGGYPVYIIEILS